jgi:hypothetical protein
MRGMSRSIRLALFVISIAGCKSNHGHGPLDAPVDTTPPIDAPVAPVFRNPHPELTDDQVALQSLQLLGGPVALADRNCNQCHGLTNGHLKKWLGYATAATTNCLTDFAVTDSTKAQQMIACLRTDPADSSSQFTPIKLGFYATAADLPWFSYLFHLASPTTADATYADFQARVLMPRGSHPKLTQDQFDIVAEWVARGLPLLDHYVPDVMSPDCTPSVTQDVLDHVTQMATTGWKAVNAGNGLDMLGCAGATSTRGCLTTYPDAATTTFGAHWEDDFSGSKIRVLRTNHYASSFWTRSSADGRFVAHGGSRLPTGSSTIIDLQTDLLIGTAGSFDPAFFPDNSGFVFQGGGFVCDQRILTASPQPTYISFNEPQCAMASTIGLYEHVGRALGGGDYWAVDSEIATDDGGHGPTLSDQGAYFDTYASMDLTPLVFNGTTFQPKPKITLATPFEGDIVLSPSATWLISRVAGSGNTQNGYTLRQLVATPSGTTYTVTIPAIGRYCVTGEKPNFSYDERWLVFHHYVDDTDAVDLGFTGPSDPGFAAYKTQGASNIYLVDMKTGDKTRITRTKPGQYALYPHFRSDGWIYFMVRVSGSNIEYVAASDAQLVAAGE